MNKKRLLIVFNKYKNFGGEEAVFNNELKYLNEHYEIKSLVFSNNKSSSVLWSSFNIISFIKTIYYIFIFKPDIAYFNNLWFKGSNSPLIAGLLSRKLKINIKLHNYRLSCSNSLHYRDKKICRDCDINNKKNSYKYKCYKDSLLLTLLINIYSKIQFAILKSEKINKIYVLNSLQKTILKNHGIKSNKIFEVKNIVNIRKKSSNLNFAKRKKFYFVGRLEEEKGIVDLVNIWEMLNVLNFELHIIGDGTFKKFVKLKAENNKSIFFHGNLENKSVLEHLESSRALIFPTKLYEGQPTIILEALSCDTPIISPDIPFISTNINDDKILTYKVGDLGLLKEIIEAYFDDTIYENQKILWNKFKNNFFINYPDFNLH